MSVVSVVSVQAASGLTVQRPSTGSQQEPSGGCGHEFGAQTPSRVQVPVVPVPVPVQFASLVTVHVPAGTQQAPGGGHGFGVQGTPEVHRRPPVAQSLAYVTVQVPLGSQQEPRGSAHGLGLQVAKIVH
jgi:hypothetical protein